MAQYFKKCPVCKKQRWRIATRSYVRKEHNIGMITSQLEMCGSCFTRAKNIKL